MCIVFGDPWVIQRPLQLSTPPPSLRTPDGDPVAGLDMDESSFFYLEFLHNLKY